MLVQLFKVKQTFLIYLFYHFQIRRVWALKANYLWLWNISPRPSSTSPFPLPPRKCFASLIFPSTLLHPAFCFFTSLFAFYFLLVLRLEDANALPVLSLLNQYCTLYFAYIYFLFLHFTFTFFASLIFSPTWVLKKSIFYRASQYACYVNCSFHLTIEREM